MLTHFGLPLLRWLDEVVLPEAAEALADFQAFIGSCLTVLETEDTFMEKVA